MVRLLMTTRIALLLSQASNLEAFDCFKDKNTLQTAALRYGDGSQEAEADAEKYGNVIGDWCFDESLADLTGLFFFFAPNDFTADISGWNVSAVTDMRFMFYNAVSFNADLSGWDVSSVTAMNNMFYRAEALDADLSGWDVSSVKNMALMFYFATSFTADISGWDVSAVKNMLYMFADASSFNADLSRWDVSSVVLMESMFDGAAFFNQNLCPWRDRLTVFNTDEMFKGTSCLFPQSPQRSNGPTFCQSCKSCKLKGESCSLIQDCCGKRICYSVSKQCLGCRKVGSQCGTSSDCCEQSKCKKGACSPSKGMRARSIRLY